MPSVRRCAKKQPETDPSLYFVVLATDYRTDSHYDEDRYKRSHGIESINNRRNEYDSTKRRNQPDG